MSVKFLLDGPVFAGTFVKFRLDETGTVFVTNKNLGSDPYSAAILAYRKGWSAQDDIEGASDLDFVELQPNLTLSNDRNSQILTSGYYAVRVDTDGVLTAALLYSGELAPPDTRKQDSLNRVLTQYRESPNLLGMISVYTKQACLAEDEIKAIPSKFDIDTAVGDQLTIIGRWLGFPRCHNVPAPVPVFGFECDGQSFPYNIGGFCENALWLGCPDVASFEVCINEDDLYRRFLYVRRYQLLGMNDYRTFSLCINVLFGSDATFSQVGRIITVNTGRSLTAIESDFIQVFTRVLPRAVSASVTIQTI